MRCFKLIVDLITCAVLFTATSGSSALSLSSNTLKPLKGPPLLLNLDAWTQWQKAQSANRLLANISPPGTASGAVIASPSRVAPNYFFVWTRDAAVSMNAVLDLYDDARSAGDLVLAAKFETQLFNYVGFVENQQRVPTLGGLGEPKFEVNGAAFSTGWCRPQNDGPALRAAVLTRFANRLLASGETGYVTSHLYNSSTTSAIKADLEYVAHHWRDANCEPWEEVAGHHFYNQLVQQRALVDGAVLARALGDPDAGLFYEGEAFNISRELMSYYDVEVGAFIPTLNQTGGLTGKTSGLDSSTVLAVLHAGFEDSDVPLIPFDDPRFISTVTKITQTFQSLYSINLTVPAGVAIGRYPEDVYNGIGFDHGNPWVLITAAFANSCYRIAQAKCAARDQTAAQEWFSKGDAFMTRVQTHANRDGSLSEQIQRDTGYMIGARDLTWSHVEVIQAVRTRDAVAARNCGH